MAQPQSATLDGLPKQFVVAMRTLFDIMDDKRTGYVKFSGKIHGMKKCFVDVDLGCNGRWTCRQIPIFQRKILPPSSVLQSRRPTWTSSPQ
jgi:hypothetical protein